MRVAPQTTSRWIVGLGKPEGLGTTIRTYQMTKQPTIELFSHGLKTFTVKGGNLLPKADLYIDCRGLKEKNLGVHGIGFDTEFQEAILLHNASAIGSMCRMVEDSLAQIPDRRGETAETSPYVVCTFCAWGIHRSVATKYLIAQYLRNKGYTVKVREQVAKAKP